MAVTRKYTEENTKQTFNPTNVQVVRAIDRGTIFFDVKIDGIQINGMKYIEYTNKEGNKGTMIAFPAEKYTKQDGETAYSNYVWFPINAELKTKIENQLTEILNK